MRTCLTADGTRLADLFAAGALALCTVLFAGALFLAVTFCFGLSLALTLALTVWPLFTAAGLSFFLADWSDVLEAV